MTVGVPIDPTVFFGIFAGFDFVSPAAKDAAAVPWGTVKFFAHPPGRPCLVRGIGEGFSTVQVFVRDNNVDGALKALKKKMQREGIWREMKLRRSYEKPSERKAREKADAIRRARKLERKRLERDGF